MKAKWYDTPVKNPFAERVDPVVARKGVFLKSFPVPEKLEMLKYCRATILAMDNKDVTGKLVFTEVKLGIKAQNRTWQIFVLL